MYDVRSVLTGESLVAAGLLYLTYQIVFAIYNVYFHPLAKYPGPKLAACTNIPYVRMLWGGTIPSTMMDLHQRYGRVVRIAPNELSYNSSEAWKEIYGFRSSGHGDKKPKANFPKEPKHYGTEGNKDRSIINADDEDHTRVRRILAHSFSDRALKEQEPLLQRWTSLLVTKLRAASDKPADMVRWYNFTTFDIMADLTFSEPLYMLEGSEYSPWVKTIFGTIKFASRLRTLSQIPALALLIRLAIGKMAKRKQAEHFRYTADRVDRRLAKEPEHPDLWTQVLKRQHTEGGLSLSEMHANASIFMIAGTETTATLLSGVTYFLLRHQEKKEKLLDELQNAFETEDDITVEALARLPYLQACLEEGLRMYPSVPTGLPREVPQGGAAICGEWVPQGTTVSVHSWASYHDERNFHRANSYIPERWLGDDDFADDDRAAFQPFSLGPRNCLGRNLAYHEARLILAKVLWNFDLELVDPQSKWYDQKIFFLWDKPALMVRLKPVDRSAGARS